MGLPGRGRAKRTYAWGHRAWGHRARTEPTGPPGSQRPFPTHTRRSALALASLLWSVDKAWLSLGLGCPFRAG